jgi:hypothetical protein
MTTAILPKMSTPAALTITLGGLTNGSSRQSTLIDNSTTRYSRIYIYPSIKMGTSPTVNTLVSLYLLRSDGTYATDLAGASDAAITLQNAQTFGTLVTTATTGVVLQDCFMIPDPGLKWGIAVQNGTGVSLDATSANHVINWVGEYPEIQA